MGVRMGAIVPNYFLPKFTRIDPPKNGEPNYGEKERSSLLSEFNRAQRESKVNQK